MISIRVDRSALPRVKAGVVDRANRRFRDQVYRMFDDLLLVSAQFSGDYVSNWRIVTQNDSLPTYERWHHKGEVQVSQQPLRAGDIEAYSYARTHSVRKPFNYKDKVQFYNPTPLEFTGTTVTGEEGTKPLRPENIIGTGILAASYLRNKYGGVS